MDSYHLFWVCHKLSSLPFGQRLPSFPYTKELHGKTIGASGTPPLVSQIHFYSSASPE